MTKSNDFTDIEFGGPATYRIVVQGVVDQKWMTRLGDMDFNTTSRAGGAPRTTLTGPIRDQAELNGVLETLYELHLPILEVRKVEDTE